MVSPPERENIRKHQNSQLSVVFSKEIIYIKKKNWRLWVRLKTDGSGLKVSLIYMLGDMYILVLLV